MSIYKSVVPVIATRSGYTSIRFGKPLIENESLFQGRDLPDHQWDEREQVWF